MKVFLQVFYGLFLSSVGFFACIGLGILFGNEPDWQTGVGLLSLLIVGQSISFLTIQRHIALQVLSGLILCIISIWILLYSSLAFFWEHEYSVPDAGVPITWRSKLMLVVFLIITQGVVFLVFRFIRKHHPENRVTG
jgi:hypothetical protein